MHTEAIACIAENRLDVLRTVGKEISRIGIGFLRVADLVLDAASIGVDQTPSDAAGKALSDALLPGLQGDAPLVFHARAVLGK
ncbi:MAG: hypothetical protein M3R23_03660 [Actinomycetota bacterium]|nr:hypothetical protein [Actinomycetota bacterium]